MNSLGVDPFVHNILFDLRDGRVLLQAIDKTHPGMVAFSRAHMGSCVLSRFKAIENTNYVVQLGKEMKFSLVGTQGADITDGNVILTLGLVWQLMREHLLTVLKSLGKCIKESDMISWANSMVEVLPPEKRLSSRVIESFKDSSLKTSLYIMDLLEAMKPGSIDPALVSAADGNSIGRLYSYGPCVYMRVCVFRRKDAHECHVCNQRVQKAWCDLVSVARRHCRMQIENDHDFDRCPHGC